MAEAVTDENGKTTARKIVPPDVSCSVRVLEKKDLPKTEEWKDVQKFLPVDILLLTVKDCETLSCLSFLNKGFVKGYLINFGFVYFGHIGDDETKSLKIAVLECNMGSGSPGGSLVLSQNAIPILRPKAVFCVGFCGSMNEKKAKLGDVIVCSKLITYAFIKHSEGEIEERGVIVPPNRNLANLIKDVGAGWAAPIKNSEDLKVKVRNDGVFLSGPEVVNDRERRNQLIKRFPQATAIEMEGEGLYAAAHDLNMEWLVIKGVSDYADGTKSDTESWRPFASLMAASVVAHILKDTIVFRDWKHYRTESDAGDIGPLKGRSSSSYSLDAENVKMTAREDCSSVFSAESEAGESATRKRRSSLSHSSDAKTAKKTAAKSGNPSDYELEKLSRELGDNWENLGRRLGFKQAMITSFDHENKKLYDKAHRMLMAWKQKEGSDGTYQILYDALCDELVNLKELAEKFCC